MSSELTKYSFNDLLEQGRVRIPKIQRDYAQGRRNQKVDEIRKVFVHTLLLVVKGKRPSTELDFIYGSMNNGAFEPLDGQQRLTTLFLLHWMMGCGLSTKDGKHALFTYETRNTSREFCDELVLHDAMQFVKEAKTKEELRKQRHESGETKGSEEDEPIIPSTIIKGRDWFKWEWKYDPTVLSMLVMIDAINDEMGDDWEGDLSAYQQNLNKITFNRLNLGDFGLSNELYIKMNARGKQLSDFDKLKSTLEEELQIQQEEKSVDGTKLAEEKDEERWRTLMDGAWIDFFWHKYARKTIEESIKESILSEDCKRENLKAAKYSELQFKKLILRLIAIQLFENSQNDDELREASYYINESQIDNLLFAYSESLTDLRSEENHVVVPSSSLTINFKRLMEDFNLLLYKGADNTYHEISEMLPPESHIDKNDKTLFDSFLETNVANDVELVFFAMLLFLRSFPPQKTKKDEDEADAWLFDKTEHEKWLVNLDCWVRAMRNVLLNDNNNQRIDKIQFSFEATQSLKKLANAFKDFENGMQYSVYTSETVVYDFLQSSNENYTRLDNQSMAEEREKAGLVISDLAWKSNIDKAEKHPYLWGQIRCLLNWSKKNLDSFVIYRDRLVSLLNYIGTDGVKFYTAMLAFAPDCWSKTSRLYEYNKDRDNSFKRYLRTMEDEIYGPVFKGLIDLWESSYKDKTVEDFIQELIKSKETDALPWIGCIIKCPSVLNEAWNKRVYIQNGHVIIAQRKTIDSHCFDPMLVYLRNLCWSKKIPDSRFKLYDSKGEYVHAFEFDDGVDKYRVQWSEKEGEYVVLQNEIELPNIHTSEEMLDFMKSHIGKSAIRP